MRTFEKNTAQMQNTLDNPPELEDIAPINDAIVRPFFSSLLCYLSHFDWSVEETQRGEE